MRIAVLAACVLSLVAGGCSTVVEGFTQRIDVNTDPPGADCTLTREGAVLGHVNPTPGTIQVRKNKFDITITCTKEGFAEASQMNKSDVAMATVGNVIIGGVVGWIVDSSTGADNKYQSPVTVTLTPVAAPPTAAAPALAPAAAGPTPLTN